MKENNIWQKLKVERQPIEIRKHIYDNPLNKDWTEKDNELLWVFLMTEEEENDMWWYSYSTFWVKDNELYFIKWVEISWMYGNYKAGTQHYISKVSEHDIVKKYLQFLSEK